MEPETFLKNLWSCQASSTFSPPLANLQHTGTEASGISHQTRTSGVSNRCSSVWYLIRALKLLFDCLEDN